MTKLEAAIAFCDFFEAEVLAELMLKHWKHPRASDREFVNDLLEMAAEVLNRSQTGEQFFEDIQPADMNLVAALWYAESCQVATIDEAERQPRQDWLTTVRRALPSCFCDPAALQQP